MFDSTIMKEMDDMDEEIMAVATSLMAVCATKKEGKKEKYGLRSG